MNVQFLKCPPSKPLQCLLNIRHPLATTTVGHSRITVDIVASTDIRITSSGSTKDVGRSLLYALVCTLYSI